jgi:hypothetical protein
MMVNWNTMFLFYLILTEKKNLCWLFSRFFWDSEHFFLIRRPDFLILNLEHKGLRSVEIIRLSSWFQWCKCYFFNSVWKKCTVSANEIAPATCLSVIFEILHRQQILIYILQIVTVCSLIYLLLDIGGRPTR